MLDNRPDIHGSEIANSQCQEWIPSIQRVLKRLSKNMAIQRRSISAKPMALVGRRRRRMTQVIMSYPNG